MESVLWVTVDEVLSNYTAFDALANRLTQSSELREAGQWLADELPPNAAVVLLARTDAALMACAAAAVLREAPTTVQRAPLGRTDWNPPTTGVLVEPIAPTKGLLGTVASLCPTLPVLVLPSLASLESVVPMSSRSKTRASGPRISSRRALKRRRRGVSGGGRGTNRTQV